MTVREPLTEKFSALAAIACSTSKSQIIRPICPSSRQWNNMVNVVLSQLLMTIGTCALLLCKDLLNVFRREKSFCIFFVCPSFCLLVSENYLATRRLFILLIPASDNLRIGNPEVTLSCKDHCSLDLIAIEEIANSTSPIMLPAPLLSFLAFCPLLVIRSFAFFASFAQAILTVRLSREVLRGSCFLFATLITDHGRRRCLFRSLFFDKCISFNINDTCARNAIRTLPSVKGSHRKNPFAASTPFMTFRYIDAWLAAFYKAILTTGKESIFLPFVGIKEFFRARESPSTHNASFQIIHALYFSSILLSLNSLYCKLIQNTSPSVMAS